MNKNRLEAFSDGVFAIVITLLVLEIHFPNVSSRELLPAMISILPSILTYFMSFALIGIYWLSHHFYFDRIKKINGTLTLMNMLMLLLISFMPIPTGILGHYPLEPSALILYGSTLMVSNLLGYLMLGYVSRNQDLTHSYFEKDFLKKRTPIYLWVNGSYLISMIFAFIWPGLSYAIYIIIIFLALKSLLKLMNQAAKNKPQSLKD